MVGRTLPRPQPRIAANSVRFAVGARLAEWAGMRIILALLLTLPLGCSHKSSSSGDPGSDPGGALDGGVSDGYFAPSALSVSGHVVDFESGQPLSSPATMATAALVPPPNVSVMGANFTLDAVPPYSTFFLAAGSPWTATRRTSGPGWRRSAPGCCA